MATLRKSQFDLATGKVWRQQTLADQIGVSPRQIEAIEQGAKSYLEPDILAKLANVFRLTTLERREFFALAAGVTAEALMLQPLAPAAILTPLLATLGVLQQPAYLHDGFFNIIALNSPMRAFFGIDQAYLTQLKDQAGANYLYALFAPASPLRTVLQHYWQPTARRAVARFRAFSLRYRPTDYFSQLFHQLCALPDFTALWQQTQQETDDLYSHVQVDEYCHPRWGEVRYLLTRTTTVTTYGNLYLVTLAPANANTLAAFATPATDQEVVEPLSPWPNPCLSSAGEFASESGWEIVA
ncbi:MAG: helix-turn-helix transcriptional regulator [Caldilineaceae bacterium]